MIWLGKEPVKFVFEKPWIRFEPVCTSKGLLEQMKTTYVYDRIFSLEDITRAVNEIFNEV